MSSSFTSDFFAGNRRALRDLFTGTAPIVMTAAGQLQRAGDSPHPFAQDASFWYFTGLEEPDVVLVMDRDKEYLIVPARPETREAFDGAVSFDELSRRSGIKAVYNDTDGWNQLGGRLKKVKHVAVLPPAPAYLEQYGMYTNPSRAALVEKLKNYNEALELLDIAMHVARLRMVKQEPEVAAIQQAIDVTVAALKDSFRPARLLKYGYEFELEAQIAYGFRKRGASGHAFPPIIASGERAVTLHNIANDGQLAAGELTVVDVGAEVQHYAADITRTVGIGQLSRRQQAVYAAVLEAQAYALDMLKPGTLLREYEREVRQFIGEKLRSLGLIRTISPETIREFYPHATSHFLGLNVHDTGDYDRPLEPGMVLTVEPGIYIAKEGIGVRIEDDVLITPTGHKILSNALPRELM